MAPCENISVTSSTEKSYGSGYETFRFLSDDCTFWNGSVKGDMNCSLAVSTDEVPVKLNKFQIIKAVVLAGVTIVIMISICRMVFQLFVRYNVRQDR